MNRRNVIHMSESFPETGDRFSVSGGQVWLPSGFPESRPEDENVDVHVQLDSGKKYITTFYTPRNITHQLEKFRESGECANGLYTFDTKWIVIRSLGKDALTIAIEDLIESEQIAHAMEQYEDD